MLQYNITKKVRMAKQHIRYSAQVLSHCSFPSREPDSLVFIQSTVEEWFSRLPAVS